jgi:hypothetical protein
MDLEWSSESMDLLEVPYHRLLEAHVVFEEAHRPKFEHVDWAKLRDDLAAVMKRLAIAAHGSSCVRAKAEQQAREDAEAMGNRRRAAE